MVRRFIVKANNRIQAKVHSNEAKTGTNLTALIVPIVFSIVIGWIINHQEEIFEINWVATVSLCFLLLGIVCVITKSTGKEKGAAVFIYPLGIQLATVYFEKKCHGQQEQQCLSDVKLGSFFSRDQVIDCIVNEFILAHKVVSVVLFRIRTDKCVSSSTKEKTAKDSKDYRLVHAFPGTIMTYRECLALRHEIMKELKINA